MSESPSPLSGHVVLVPWGCGTREDNDRVRVSVERLGGDVSYAGWPAPGTPRMGKRPERATHEFLPKGRKAETELPTITAAALSSMFSHVTKAAAAILSPLVRTAHVPVVERADASVPGSRYFGNPWMPDGMEWPDLDGEPMAFVLQLDLATLPAAPGPLEGREGLLLFFHAGEYDETRQSLVTLVDPAAAGGPRKPPKSAAGGPALAVVDWKAVADMPDLTSLERVDGGADLLEYVGDLVSEGVGKVRVKGGREVDEAKAIERAVAFEHHTWTCDKLGGWPAWEQGDETPLDREGAAMELVFQVGHEGVVLGRFNPGRVEWPTWGRGQIFGSRATGEFRYVWACD